MKHYHYLFTLITLQTCLFFLLPYIIPKTPKAPPKFLNLYDFPRNRPKWTIWSVAHKKLLFCFKGLKPCCWKASILQISGPTLVKHN